MKDYGRVRIGSKIMHESCQNLHDIFPWVVEVVGVDPYLSAYAGQKRLTSDLQVCDTCTVDSLCLSLSVCHCAWSLVTS